MRPAQRPVDILLQQGVFLLESIPITQIKKKNYEHGNFDMKMEFVKGKNGKVPWDFLLDFGVAEDFGRRMPLVGRNWLTGRSVSIAYHLYDTKANKYESRITIFI